MGLIALQTRTIDDIRAFTEDVARRHDLLRRICDTNEPTTTAYVMSVMGGAATPNRVVDALLDAKRPPPVHMWTERARWAAAASAPR